MVDYPFSYSKEDWRLLLCLEESGEESKSYRFRLYDDAGELIQDFLCGVQEEKPVFRFDDLYDCYGGYGDDMAVFPSDVEENGGTMGLFWPQRGRRIPI